MNQFFAGVGGEDKADMPPDSHEGALGPGKRLQELLADSAQIVVTVSCGDNYFAEHHDEALEKILQFAKAQDLQMVVAGPAFASGRYGFTCAQVCHYLSTSLNIDGITGMHVENPGVERYKQNKNKRVYALPTTESVSGMNEALASMAKLISKLAVGSEIGPASEEGYIPRGIRTIEVVNQSGAQRAIEMLLNKMADRPFLTEIPVAQIEEVPAAAPIRNLADASLALVTTSGVVAHGNPDGFKMQRNTQWKKYSIDKLNSMTDAKWDVRHGGYNNIFMLKNPNYGVPLDVCRELERERVFERLYPFFYTTPGINGLLSVMKKLGREMVNDVCAEGVDGAILVAT